MTMGLIKALIASFFGTLGFGILLLAPRRSLFWACAIGAVSYGLYWLLQALGAAELPAMFLGAAVGSVLAQWAARRLRMVATIFVTLAIIPLVPGLGLYRCMAYLAQGQNALGAQTGVVAMMNILMIALGIGVGGFWPRRRKRNEIEKKS